MAAALVLVACGSASVSGSPTITVSVSAAAGRVLTGHQVQLTATSAACSTCSGTAALEVDRLSVSVAPEQARVLSAGQVQLAALVTGWSDTAVRWSATAGTVDEAGLFTAPGQCPATRSGRSSPTTPTRP